MKILYCSSFEEMIQCKYPVLAAISLILIYVDLKHIPIISEIGIYAHQNIKQTVIEIRNWERLHNSRDYFSAAAFNQNRLS